MLRTVFSCQWWWIGHCPWPSPTQEELLTTWYSRSVRFDELEEEAEQGDDGYGDEVEEEEEEGSLEDEQEVEADQDEDQNDEDLEVNEEYNFDY